MILIQIFYSVFNMITTVSLWILFLLIISRSSSKVAVSSCDHTLCSPFRLLVIWHTSNGEDSAFIEQKRLLIRTVDFLPQGTEVQVTAINTQLNHILNFRKNTTNDWIYKISMYIPKSLENHTIQGSLINKLILDFLKQNSKKEVADKILLVASEKTETEQRILEMVECVKGLVVFTGWNPPPPLWTSLASDEHRLVTLNTTYENLESNINGAAEKVMDFLCRDSRLICDTDEFLAGERCINCSYICSEDTKARPVICRELCPNYKRLSLKNATKEEEEYVKDENIKPEIVVWRSISISLFALIAIVSVTVYVQKRRNSESTTHLPVCYKKTRHLSETAKRLDKERLERNLVRV